jgi:hypothetical protein
MAEVEIPAEKIKGTKIFSFCGDYLRDVHNLDWKTCRRRDSLKEENENII